MKVLFISQAYPPYPAVGSLRARNLVAELRRQGHAVQVVTERLPSDTGHVRIREPDLMVHTAEVGAQYRVRAATAVRRLRTLVRRSEPVAGVDSFTGGAGAASDGPAMSGGEPRPAGVRRLVLALLRLPDDEQRFIRPAYRLARALMRDGAFDLVYTSAPSFSTLIVGLLLRRRTGCRWVAEFRDPWTDQHDDERSATPRPVAAVHRWLERQCLLAADQVVAVTEGACERLRAKVPPPHRNKFLLARNGIHALTDPAAHLDGPFRIVYAGTFYHERDPRPFLDALRQLVTRRGLHASTVRVDFVGHCRTYHGASVEQMVADRGLAGLVHFHDWMPHEEAQALLRSADLLLFIALRQPLQVPNKLYDYLGTRRAILAFVDADGESARMLQGVGGHYVVTDVTVARVEAALESAIDDAARRRAVGDGVGDEAVLRRWLTEQQLGDLVRTIGA